MIELIISVLTGLIVAVIGMIFKMNKDIGELKGKVDMIIRILNGRPGEANEKNEGNSG